MGALKWTGSPLSTAVVVFPSMAWPAITLGKNKSSEADMLAVRLGNPYGFA